MFCFSLFFQGYILASPPPLVGRTNLSSLVGGKISPHPPQIKNREASLGVRVPQKNYFWWGGRKFEFFAIIYFPVIIVNICLNCEILFWPLNKKKSCFQIWNVKKKVFFEWIVRNENSYGHYLKVNFCSLFYTLM